VAYLRELLDQGRHHLCVVEIASISRSVPILRVGLECADRLGDRARYEQFCRELLERAPGSERAVRCGEHL